MFDAKLKVDQLKEFVEYLRSQPTSEETERLIVRIGYQIEFLENEIAREDNG